MPKTSIKYERRSRRLQSRQTATSPTSPRSNQISSPLQTISDEDIIAHILFSGYLHSTPKQTATIRSVCHQFNSITNKFCTTLDAKPSLLKTKITLSTRIVTQIVRNFPSLIHLDFSHMGDAFTDKHMLLLSPSLGTLRVLKLRGTAVTNHGVIGSLGFTHSYRHMYFDNLPMEVLDLSKTRTKDRHNIGRLSIIAIAARCPNIKSLQLSLCREIDDEVLDCVISQKMNQLEELDLSMCNITAKGCCYLTRLPNLRAVNISSALGVSGQAIRSMLTGYCPEGIDGTDSFDDDHGRNIKKEVLVGIRRAHSNLRVIAAQFANNGVDGQLLEVRFDSLVYYSMFLLILTILA